MDIEERRFPPSTVLKLIRSGMSPVLARVLASRGITDTAEVSTGLSALIPYSQLLGAEALAKVLADAIVEKKRLLIVADYDADGATACSVGVRALRAFGANVGFIIPNRIEHGYGLTPAIARIACSAEPKPDYLVTVDNGIASHAGIEEANRLGVPVLVTDHHLPGETHPDALCIVNPNQHGCPFPSKALAGCGVMWYVMWALQDELLERGIVSADPEFSVDSLLPIVAIGTVADVVALDTNNRILVNEGLLRVRAGHSFPGVDFLAKVSGKDPRMLATSDIAFGIGPRINAAGRLESMDAGVECLTTDSVARAQALAEELHGINDRRKAIEGDMTDEAVRRLLTDVRADRYTAVLHAEDWHQGVIGIVAGRLKERIWRPTFILASGKDGELKGSGRSIPGFHLRDALDLVDRRHPGLLPKFGGHAMAAGVTVRAGGLAEFAEAFEKVAREMLTAADLQQTLLVDGALEANEMSLETVAILKEQVWGQAFPEPTFYDAFQVLDARSIGGGKHMSMLLQKDGRKFRAVKFRHTDAPPQKGSELKLAYKLDANSFNDETNVQLLVETFG
ncbi:MULTISPECIES: single-stranded-DNA-specific exonuclease RecJ [unclassified Variovorax]|uniref:single-stranded-DNA-specific exonuclease RecJ n=1 Tax=unclassified Variovorax TaxID=663243 RepID=UPI00076C67E7|nr:MULTISPECIES: single-stranded-DNA-specific exonuclease RecJ [unclassified Variovorax]KWT98339.1 Single-stranded-DNA-specific exonuclease RecJ [Variovorax sp. WDL1]PNG50002.1 Single-stranded-DNA-specific exonuclease RecJ [Variovorax sp. B2]PNG50874.1 Single-stranded-DNA-specific exonuclease RecJ [Variovorax sp. B4]VTU41602.1 Single-stranded-DNA-specific exonuclease RecJ [Variovorax sp. PBL-H6]VTU44699.1 Single-stranded-DNA-specific exonuclease RecJ [Variovorax sp. SRS16]